MKKKIKKNQSISIDKLDNFIFIIDGFTHYIDIILFKIKNYY